ncbi:MutS protein msh4 [Mucor velutinosus]|uniref:Eukaryotic translation initiation factor 2-alpha kinase 1 n=1 Tax=Mucor velutinosus TaxID=708070 RepID=A0AAN7HME1_9FUNG|nr:MutS protein msh4 [Mucor velutinosus]
MKALDKTKIDTVFESDSSHPSSSSSSLSSSSVETAECSRKLWKKPHHHQHNSTIEDTSHEDYPESNNDVMDQDASFFYAIAKESLPSSNKHRRQQQHHQQQQHRRHENNLAVTRNASNDASSKRQTKLLLVSLIESLCQTYGDSPESTRKIFLMICQTLSSLGFIDSEFIDEVAGVRSTYHKAFEQLFYTAAQTVRQQELRSGNQPKLLTSAQQQEILKERIESLSTSHSSSSSVESFLGGNEEIADQDISRPLKYSLSIQQSRYNNDFVQVGMLGRGGFACAYKARNKLDDIEYAIKKIRLLDQEEDDGYDKIFREIKNLARLEHHNVVRYYSSWLEYAASIDENHGEDDEDEDLSWISSSSPNNEFTFDDDDDKSSIFNGQDPTFDLSEEDSLNNNRPTTAEEMSYISFGTSDNEPSEADNVQLCASSSNSTIRKSCYGGSSTKQKQEKGGFILFIQMQLCPSTLHEYLKFRNQNPSEYFDDQQNIDLFSQILQGCAYIHQQGLIHRDLKPSNIFLSRPATVPEHRNRRRTANGSGTSLSDANINCKCCTEALIPKIGDFGLAASVLHAEDEDDEVMDDEEDDHYLASTFESQHSNSSSSIIELFAASHPHSHRHRHHRSKHDASSSNSDSILSLRAANSFKNTGRPRLRRNRTSGVGTRTYAAPEQLATPSYNYDEKADIYSLGIILFELYNPFSSAMERAIAIDQLKKGIFPDKFSQVYPVEKQVISRMMNPDPCLRPTALDILDLDIFNPQSQHHSQQEQQQQLEHIELAAISTTTELNIIHDREMAEMRDRYCQMKQEKEDLQRRLDELEHKLNHCNVNEHPHKRPHELDDDNDDSSTAVVPTVHQHKKKEIDSLFQSTLLAKFMMPN